MSAAGNEDALWIFGYSSLIWKHSEVDHEEARVGFVEGFQRRFWQGSTDHRGTAENPGLVASLYSRDDFRELRLTEADDHAVGLERWRVYGRAFRVSSRERARVIATLNDREVDGYQHVWLPVYAEAADGTRLVVTERALVYVARITNRLFTGCLKHDDIVARVLRCEGKSGPNRAYLTNLAEAADKIGDLDPHLAALVRLLPSATGTSPLLK